MIRIESHNSGSKLQLFRVTNMASQDLGILDKNTSYGKISERIYFVPSWHLYSFLALKKIYGYNVFIFGLIMLSNIAVTEPNHHIRIWIWDPKEILYFI